MPAFVAPSPASCLASWHAGDLWANERPCSIRTWFKKRALQLVMSGVCYAASTLDSACVLLGYCMGLGLTPRSEARLKCLCY